jgi:tol-pal system protein YbgF
MKLFTRVLPVFTVALLLLAGCATTKQAASLQGQITDLQQKVEILRGRVSSEMQQNWVNFETSLEQLRQENKILRANIEEDRALLNKIANDLEVLKKDYEAKTSALTKEKEKREDTTVAMVPPAPPPPPKEEPKDMEGAYQQAYGTYRSGDYPAALKQFKAFLNTYPKSEYADNAQYWIGESYYQQGDYERAILEYEQVVKQYPKGDKVASALLKEGFAFLDLGDRVNAKLLFQKVIKQYPQSPQAEIAAKKLKTLD